MYLLILRNTLEEAIASWICDFPSYSYLFFPFCFCTKETAVKYYSATDFLSLDWKIKQILNYDSEFRKEGSKGSKEHVWDNMMLVRVLQSHRGNHRSVRLTTSSAFFSVMTNHLLLNSGNAGRTQLYKCNEASILPGQIRYNWFDTYHHRGFRPDKLCACSWFTPSSSSEKRWNPSAPFGGGEMYWCA
jgi:hypothetical protein